MNITIGVRDTSAPLSLDVDMSASEILATVKAAILGNTPVEFTETQGSIVLIPSEALAYVKISKQEQHRVGFGFV